MNIQKIQPPVPPTFTPYILQITVDTLQDDYLLRRLAEKQYAIPELLFPQNPQYHTLCQNLLNKILKAVQL